MTWLSISSRRSRLFLWFLHDLVHYRLTNSALLLGMSQQKSPVTLRPTQELYPESHGQQSDVCPSSHDASSFTSIIASQKEVAASHASALPRTMASTSAREITAACRLTEDTVVLCPSGARLHRMFYRVLRAVHTVVTCT